MNSAGFILAINFSVGAIFALVFALIAVYDRAYRSARWFAFAYSLGMVNVTLEFALTMFPDYQRILVVAIFASYLGALLAGVVGLSRRYAAPPPSVLLIAVFVISVAINIYIVDLPRDSVARLFLFQSPYVVAQAIGAFVVFQHAGKRALDLTAGIFLTLSAFNYLAKPFVAWSVGGPGATPQDYINTSYALYSQTMGAILAVALGVLFIMVYMRDMLADIRAESETDRLSGLLNRRGLETRAKVLIDECKAKGVPVSMVICDLDHFKQINDEFGHAAGDCVIEAFSDLLRGVAGVKLAVGRIGGEEFALVLPATNGSAARLFAESVRSTFCGMAIKDLPRVRRFTASFGVAEMMAGEVFSNLLRRADMALYEAKRDGRNRVCAAPAPLVSFQAAPERRNHRARA